MIKVIFVKIFYYSQKRKYQKCSNKQTKRETVKETEKEEKEKAYHVLNTVIGKYMVGNIDAPSIICRSWNGGKVEKWGK